MQDLRLIALCNTPLKQDRVDDFINSLPSNKDKKTDKPRTRSTVKKRKPGEIPEWKKKRAKQNNDNCQKTG